MEFSLPRTFQPTHLGIVSRLLCNPKTHDGQELVRISYPELPSSQASASLLEGRDALNWAYNCENTNPTTQHKLPSIFESFTVIGPTGNSCQGHNYFSAISIPPSPPIKKISLTWTGGAGVLQLDKITLSDQRTGESLPLHHLEHSGRWAHKEDIGTTAVFENRRALPRAWLVGKVISIPPQHILRTIHSSRLPWGEQFNPSQIALVEEPIGFKVDVFDAKA